MVLPGDPLGNSRCDVKNLLIARSQISSGEIVDSSSFDACSFSFSCSFSPVTDISNEFSSLTSQYDAELILLILTYTPIDNIEHIIENEEFGEIVLSVFEGENDRTTHLITLFIRFMESMTTQGIQPETNLANFIDALQEPISELSDSEDVDISASKLRILSELFNTSIDYILCNDKKELDVIPPSSKANENTIQLSTDEQELLKLYRELPYEGKATVKAIVQNQYDLYVKPKCNEKAI